MRRLAVVVASLSFLVAACGGGDDGGSGVDTTAPAATVSQETTAAPPGSGADTTPAPGGEVTTATADGELPMASFDFNRVCTTQVGFSGASAYDSTAPGPHTVVVFMEDDFDEGEFNEDSTTLPDGWALVQDDNFKDNHDMAAAQLVACGDRTSSTPNGTTCEFDNEGTTLTLDLVDATYDLVIYEAVTGAEVGRTSIDAASTECPFFVFIDEGQTEYVNTPGEDDLVNALKPFVDPG